MSALEQINGNSKSQDRDAPVQISKAQAIIRGLTDEMAKENDVSESSAKQYALGYLAAVVENLTSAVRFDREWAKKEVRRLEKQGRDAIKAEQNPEPCKHPALAQHGRDEDGADLLRCLECGAIGTRKELTA